MSNKKCKFLSKEEIKKLYDEMKEGSLKARETLILAYKPFVYHCAGKFKVNYAHLYDDLASAGFVGLVKAVDTYILNDKSQLITYASTCINNEMLMYIRKDKRHNCVDSLNRSIGAEGEEFEAMNVVEDKNACVQDEVEKICMAEHLHGKMDALLTPYLKQILEMRYGMNGGEPLTQKQISERLDISRSYVSRLEKKAIDLLKKDYAKEKE